MKLTAPQRQFLERVSRETFYDNSGRGLLLHDGREVLMAKRLLEKGFVTNAFMMPFTGPKITKAGRAALELADKIAAFTPSSKGPIVLIARERRLIEDSIRLAAQADAPGGLDAATVEACARAAGRQPEIVAGCLNFMRGYRTGRECAEKEVRDLAPRKDGVEV